MLVCLKFCLKKFHFFAGGGGGGTKKFKKKKKNLKKIKNAYFTFKNFLHFFLLKKKKPI